MQNQKTILIIEDDVALNQAIKFKLEKCGHKAVDVFNAEDALKILGIGTDSTGSPQEQKIDLVWLDYLLPGMNGLEFLEKIRTDEKTKDLKVIMISVSGGVATVEKARKLGIVDYIVKSGHNLNEIVERVLKEA